MILLPQYKGLFYRTPKHRYWFVTGGRGSGKSFHVAVFLLNLTYEPGHVILFTRWTLVSAEMSIIPEFLEKMEILGCGDDFYVKNGLIVNLKTGSKILFRGIKNSSGNQTARLKSIQGVTTWVLDEGEEVVSEDVFDKIDLSIRHKSLPNRTIVVMNPSYRGHFLYTKFAIANRPDTCYIHTTYRDNEANLSTSFLAEAERTRQANLSRYNHVFQGEWTDNVSGLLWNKNIIERQRVKAHPELIRIVVAIDPAVTSHAESDETGIVIIGKDGNNAYVLEDLSGRYTPNQWASIAVSACKRYDCSIVAEVNQGGDMVTQIIRNVDPSVRVKHVRATKGKYMRAEPVYALYEQGRVWHVGEFPLMENQMIFFNPDVGDSPDRVDALVWGVSELMMGKRQFFAI